MLNTVDKEEMIIEILYVHMLPCTTSTCKDAHGTHAMQLTSSIMDLDMLSGQLELL